MKIYHNPRCSKSRQTLEILTENGYNPEIIKYLESPPSPSELKKVISLLKIKTRELLRKGEKEYKDFGVNEASLSDSDLISLMCKYPKVIERPIVVNGNKAVIGRPPEAVLDII